MANGRNGDEWVRKFSLGSGLSVPASLTCAASDRTAVPALPPNHMENGRLFHGYHKGIYMYPCDEVCFKLYPEAMVHS